MRRDTVARAKKALEDLAYEAQTGDGRSLKDAESLPPPDDGPEPKKKSGRNYSQQVVFSAQAERGAIWWESRQLRVWAEAGRLTSDGALRVGTDPLNPYNLDDIARAWPQLPPLDCLAALVELDGVVEENFMGNPEHEYIRKVVETIADERVTRALQGRDETITMRELIRQEVREIFREMVGQFGQETKPQMGGMAGKGQRKCGRCGELGHMKSTCRATGPAAADKWACTHCSNLAGVPLSAPVTHPVAPKEFHKDDPSFREAA